ncbi:cytochrome-c oxidase, cbb3-type subunit III [Tahibacter amnicola]|uniref:Cbb3-type cytochrome c oxidase subunit n=1 Tax=Tahibacter amnicola TaxID=2976241 RepID=A0ABY6BDR1_9GAMM|nr:cytochrome-c oxidase, cbb3-type subunit III [Tahibacter amnicola]UXI66475.1 cytochrome-c oxidase, cbb3-type subunit III [Tahibacter amnicola]
MTSAWSWFVIAVTLLNVIGLAVLLFATAKKRTAGDEQGATTGHVWDENITELNHPLPRWWLGLFVLTLVFALGYLAVYPGFGNFAGLKGWTSAREVEKDLDTTRDKLESLYAQFRNRPVDDLARDAAALKVGHSIFLNSCAACHGSDARGAAGFPNLADRDWLWGGSAEAVLHSVSDGRVGTMPPLASALPPDGVADVAHYVRSLSGLPHDGRMARAGKDAFEGICAACHGKDGKGNIAVGAPNLTDEAWLYGSSQAAIERAIRQGRSGRMPAWLPLLGEDRVRLVSAWVLAQSQADNPTGSQAGAP